MKKRSASPARSTSYPKGGTFAQLLTWHLTVWGTHPKCSLEKAQPKFWKLYRFAEDIHGGRVELASAKKNLEAWRAGRRAPEVDDQHRVERIFTNLFADAEHLRRWKKDLHEALEKERAEKQVSIKRGKSATPANVPLPAGNFVGRDDELRKLVRMVTAPKGGAPILVQGMVGIGKTELTKALAHRAEVVRHFGERRWFIPLQNVNCADALQEIIRRTVHGGTAETYQKALREAHGKRTLLILDGLETPWWPPTERSKVQQTLREFQRIEGLTVVASFRGARAVGGPRWRELSPLEPLSYFESGSLLAAIAGKWIWDDPDFRALNEELSGVPPLIVPIAESAHGRHKLAPSLKKWRRDGPAINLSFELDQLTEAAQRLFALLGALPAGIAVADAAAFLGENDAFEAEEALRSAGWIVDGHHRIGLLGPIREFARRNRKPTDGDTRRWTSHYLTKAEEIATTIRTLDSKVSGLAALDLDGANIEAAIEELIARDELQIAISALLNITILSAAADWKTSIFEKLAEAFRSKEAHDEEAWCKLHLGHAAISRKVKDTDVAQRAYIEARYIFRSLGDSVGEAHCLRGISAVLAAKNERGRAITMLERAIKSFALLGDDRQEIDSVMALAGLVFFSGDTAAKMDVVRARVENTVVKCQRLGLLVPEVDFTWWLGSSLERNHDAAKAFFETSLALAKQADYKAGQARAMCSLAGIAVRHYDLEMASALLDEATGLSRESRDFSCISACLMGGVNLKQAEEYIAALQSGEHPDSGEYSKDPAAFLARRAAEV